MALFIKPEDFEQIDIGIFECESSIVIWENKTDILITCWRIHKGYGYDAQALLQCAEQSNLCLNWIEEQKEYIQKIISENSAIQREYGYEMTGENFFDRLCLRRIQIDICVQDEIPLEELACQDEIPLEELCACMYVDIKPFLFAGHCHCIEVAVLANEDRTYEVEVIEDMQHLLLEIRDELKEQNVAACEWAKNNNIFYAFDDDGNMLAVVRQQFYQTIDNIDNKLISEVADDHRKKKNFLGNKLERSALYFIREEWETEGIPMPFGFITKELICENGVFTITSSSGHEAVSGTFFVMQEALTMIEMLLDSRGVTEEEINKCYYTFLVEDHQKYLEKEL